MNTTPKTAPSIVCDAPTCTNDLYQTPGSPRLMLTAAAVDTMPLFFCSYLCLAGCALREVGL